MASLNKATLIGNVGKDPAVKTLNNGGKVASFSLATSESWRDKRSGERREKTEWHNIVVWNEHLITLIEKYVAKGSKLYVEGAIETRKYQDQSGTDRYMTEIVLKFDAKIVLLGDAAPAREEDRSSDRPAGDKGGASPSYPRQGVSQDPEDDIPFMR